MHEYLKLVGIFVGGAAAGAAAAYFLTKNHYEKFIQKEIDEVKAHYKKRAADLEKHVEETVEEVTNLLNKNVSERAVSVREIVKEQYGFDPEEAVVEEKLGEERLREEMKSQHKSVTDYTSYHKKDAPTVEETEAEEKPNHPYVITSEEYLESKTGYEQEVLMYYEADDTLTTEADEIIPDEVSMVGPDALFDFDPDKKIHTVYVRDDKKSVEYEIVYNVGSFSGTVLGYEPETLPVKRKLRGPAYD